MTKVTKSTTLRCVARATAWSAVCAALLPLSGCGLAALPCRAASATLKIIPVVGHAAATPFDACSSAID
ncbi:hypothetical protein NID80_30145 [Paraburkholderia megapolitana]|nr:DUF6726 family protein [Paraburkholderia sp. CHISQ3]MCX4165770.1 hypothetical protein [Paraburkholderia megapolitana]MDN7161261.1 hypothetical protein [Paraburkholderia sp. CHISQ3]MDQ6498308.1 hypothetical protein [Paraburkholderia megapolitana]